MGVAELCRRFHERFGLVVRDEPELDGLIIDEKKRRERLMLEEVAEFICAMYGYEDEKAPELAQKLYNAVTKFASRHYPGGVRPRRGDLEIVKVGRELADVLFMAYGTALHYGIDLDAIAAEVWRAHMERIPNPPDKPTKPPDWAPPDVAGVISGKVPA